ncbi:MAG: glycosyltransferase family 2 protein [bacterium]|nr:glycosyltransferase family 2 protein [bacterium]
MEKKKKIIAIFIAYNASKTLEKFYTEFPKHFVDDIILVDDFSHDNTFELSKKLGIESYQNPVNLGYGGNIKEAVKIALGKGAEIIVDIHPDGEYKPSSIPAAIREVEKGAGLVLGSRFSNGDNPGKNGMYPWKILPIRILNKIDEVVLGIKIDDLHQGFRVYTKELLEKSNFEANSNDYLFSFEIIVQAVYNHIKIAQVPVETCYSGKKRGASLKNCLKYSFGTFGTLFLFILAKSFYKSAIFRKN